MAKQISDEQRALLLAEYEENHLSTYELGMKYGVEASTVSGIAKRAGVVRQGPRSADSPVLLAAGAWVYDKDGIARWVPGAVPTESESA